MQKKIIALAVAGLASTAAFAQTNVQIYGIVDYGYAYRWDNDFTATNGSSIANQSAFNSGQASGSRIGFKGTEDLGNGLKAVFLVEQGLAIDSTASAAGTQASSDNKSISFTRQAYAGLTGNFGTLIGGRLDTPHRTLWSKVIDPFGAGTVGQYGNALGGAAGGDVVRVDNAVAYISPSFSGFTLTAAYSNKLSGQESAPVSNNLATTGVTNGNDTWVAAFLAQYAAGGLNLGLNYHYAKFQAPSVLGGALQLDDTYNVTLGGNYDFKSFKLHGAIAYNDTSFVNTITNNADLEIWNYMIGATIPVGKIDIKGAIYYSDADQFGDLWQYAIGANYNLSKRTDIYTAYSFVDADQQRLLLGAATSAASASLGGSAGVGDASQAGMGYAQGIQIGLRHKF
jgi:predicted porin